jgi:hypothetical protein
MALTYCETCGGVEVADACVCQMDGYITALEEDNSRLREQLEKVTMLIREALEACDICHGAEDSPCARCASFRAWYEQH